MLFNHCKNAENNAENNLIIRRIQFINLSHREK